MRIKDFTDTIRHLTDPFNIPEARRMLQENPALTQEQFKAGGIVEPGVTHYGQAKHDDPKFGIKKGDELGEGILQYGKNKATGYQYRKKHGEKTFFVSDSSYTDLQNKATNLRKDYPKNIGGPGSTHTWENLTKDPDFEIFFKEQIDVNPKVKELMEQAHITKEATPEEIFKKIAVVKDKKGNQGTVTLGNLRNRFNEVYKPQKGYVTIAEIAKHTPYSEIYLKKALNLSKFDLPDINTAMKSKEGRSRYSLIQRSKKIFEHLKDAGVELAPIEPASLRRKGKHALQFKAHDIDPFTGGVKFGKTRFVKPAEDVVAKLKNMVKLAGTTEASLNNPSSWRDEIKKQSKASPEYKKYKYSVDTGNRTNVVNALNHQFDMMNDVQLRMYVASNPKLKDKVTTKFDNATSRFFNRDLSDLTDQEIRTNIKFEEDHIRPMSSVKQDPYTKKVVDGLKIEYPRNFQILPKVINTPTKRDVEKRLQQIIGKKDPKTLATLKHIDNWFANRGLSYYADGKIRGSTAKGLLTESTQKLGIDLEKVLKTKRLDPYGRPLVEGGEKLLGSVKEREEVTKMLSNNFDCEFHGKIGGPAKCNTPEAYRKSFNEVVERAAAGDKPALTKLQKFTQTMKKLKGPLKWTGYGLLGEIGFMVPFAVGDYTTGKSWKRILGNASDWGFGPMFGQSEDEEIIANLPEDSLGAEAQEALAANTRLKALTDPNRTFPQGRIGMDPKRFQEAQTKVIEDADLDFLTRITPFMEGPRNQYLNPLKLDEAFLDWEGAQNLVKEQEAQRIQERRDRGFIAEEGWEKLRTGRMGGGIAGIRRPWAIPPESGPDPYGGGLSSQFNRVKKLTG